MCRRLEFVVDTFQVAYFSVAINGGVEREAGGQTTFSVIGDSYCVVDFFLIGEHDASASNAS